jgi:hypothetical protein
MTVDARAVDVEFRRRVHSVADALAHVALYSGLVDVAGNLVEEPAGIKIDSLGVAHQRVKVQAR